MKRTIGVVLLGAWLIVNGLSHLLHLSFSGMGILMSVIAVAAGALIILGV